MARDAQLVSLVAGLILVSSLIPVGGMASGVPGADKLVHVVGYGTLCATVLRWRAVDAPSGYLLAVVAVAAYGGGVELLQGTVPTRTPSHLDALANAAGATLVAVGWWRLRGR